MRGKEGELGRGGKREEVKIEEGEKGGEWTGHVSGSIIGNNWNWFVERGLKFDLNETFFSKEVGQIVLI